MKIALVWGSSTGNTENAAEQIKGQLGVDFAISGSIAEVDVASLVGCDVIIVGCSTWNTGEMQEDWNDPFEAMGGLNFAGSRLAVFGCGDQSGYAANYVDGMATIYARFIERGASGGYGFTSTSGYEFEESLADVGEGQFCGLALDEENQGDQTEARVTAWCAQLKSELGL
ncbi:MAG: flavodoxin [Planctomycetota bacterium]